MGSLEGRLLFAVPKKGRLQQPTLDLLSGADISFHRSPRLDIALVKNHPIALVFLPAADIPTFVGEGRVDLGITGWDQVVEHEARQHESPTNSRARQIEKLNKMSKKTKEGEKEIEVPEKGDIVDPRQLVGKNVVTSFVGLTEEYFGKLEAEDEENSRVIAGGSVEAACALGVADGIVDLVESGETMRAASLHPLTTLVTSTAVLIKSPHPSPANLPLITLIASRIKGVITAQRYVFCQYNIPRSLLTEATKISPGKRAPTITALEESGWIAISVMVEKKEIAGVMDRLAAVGATDILVLDIANSRSA
ncbi:MAG: hypothetical protein Q9191_007292 [Dirinaria sp. TL-2023a]